jgi:hypothetical protein
VVAHPGQIAAYTAEYLTKTTDDFGLPVRYGNLAGTPGA